jgi:predicted RNase H-like HicB family nuclease
MQYQVFVQSSSEQHYVASVVGMPDVTAEGQTEAEAISRAKAALESKFAIGKIVTIDVQSKSLDHSMPYAGIFANDPTFEDWMQKLAAIRQEANQVEDEA